MLQSKQADVGYEFLKTELHTGLTLAGIALDSDNEEKISRNRKNSRLAYDTVIRTRPRVPLTADQERDVAQKLQQLRKSLEKLGEKFDHQESA